MTHARDAVPDAADLLAWYDANRRSLPWRALPGAPADPYAVWLSEIMLQQTTTVTAAPYFEAFLRRWPRLPDLAAAPLEEVLEAWAGLGYYARARNLHKCARAVVERHGGRFPDTEEALLALPGIGPYTAAAIAAIAFGRRAVVIDGNVERVVSRLFALSDPLPGARPAIRAAADRITPDARAGDFAQAMMDLGATVCVPRAPRCGVCPWSEACRGRREEIAETLPRKKAKAAKPERRGTVFWLEDPAGRVLLRRRPETALLGGMMELPGSDWHSGAVPAEPLDGAPADVAWTLLEGRVRHVFSHFRLELRVAVGRTAVERGSNAGIWIEPEALDRQALPSVMRKAVEIARAGRAPLA